MRRWRSKLALAAGSAAVLSLAIPAFSQQAEGDRPQSLLPPGFGEQAQPAPAPSPATPAPGAPPAPTNILPPAATATAPRAEAPGLEGITLDSLSEEDLAAIEASLPKPIEIPDFARRPVDVVGPMTEAGWGLGYDAWGGMNGRFLSSLMRRIDAPLPSRWMSMLLRRALLSRVPTPSYVHPVDWVAERAWLLVRMGEADAARMLVQAIDVDQFTPKMFQVGVQTALATADPAALCPLVGPGRETSDEPVWQLSDAMCAGLRGDAAQATTLIDRARRRSGLDAIDVELAEKIVGAGANARRAVTVQWEDVDSLNSWRFGMASATGLQIPDRLMNGAGPHVWAWQARAPMVPLEQRLAAADRAAVLGVFSNRSLVDIYSLVADTTDPSEIRGSVAERLRTAYVGRGRAERLEAMRSLWNEGTSPTTLHARHILTAAAAGRLRPSEAVADDIDDLIASMLAGGLDTKAARWAGVVENMEGAAADRAWALLAVGSPQPAVSISSGRISDYDQSRDGDGAHARGMLVAALAGLGRIDTDDAVGLAEDMGINLAAASPWTRALDAAAGRRQRATVALIAAAGMQTGGWAGVPAPHLYRILRALRQVGLEYEARMIAAEAISRL